MNEEQKNSLSLKTMIFGIISIAVGGSGLLGIIFGAIALGNAKKYAAENNGVVDGKAKVGKILGTLGLVFGIIALVAYVIYFIVMIVAMIGGGAAAAMGGGCEGLEDLLKY